MSSYEKEKTTFLLSCPFHALVKQLSFRTITLSDFYQITREHSHKAREASRAQVRHLTCELMHDMLSSLHFTNYTENEKLSKRLRHEHSAAKLIDDINEAAIFLRSLNVSSCFFCLPTSLILQSLFHIKKAPSPLDDYDINPLAGKKFMAMLSPFQLNKSLDLSIIIEVAMENELRDKKRRRIDDQNVIPKKGCHKMKATDLREARNNMKETLEIKSGLASFPAFLLDTIRTFSNVHEHFYFEECHRLLSLFSVPLNCFATRAEVTLFLRNLSQLDHCKLLRSILLVGLFAAVRLSKEPQVSFFSLFLQDRAKKKKHSQHGERQHDEEDGEKDQNGEQQNEQEQDGEQQNEHEQDDEQQHEDSQQDGQQQHERQNDEQQHEREQQQDEQQHEQRNDEQRHEQRQHQQKRVRVPDGFHHVESKGRPPLREGYIYIRSGNWIRSHGPCVSQACEMKKMNPTNHNCAGCQYPLHNLCSVETIFGLETGTSTCSAECYNDLRRKEVHLPELPE